MTAPATVSATPPAARPAHAKRLAFLDALRGVAAMWVVIFHIGEGGQAAALQAALPGWLNTAIFPSGHFGVPIFFVLSGFVIALSIGDDAVDLPYIGRFALRRAIRLDIPYWASIAVTLGFVAAKSAIQTGTPATNATVGQVLAHMFYLQDFLGVRSINTVYWTLCFEIQFYLIFCALLGVAQYFRRAADDHRALAIVFTIAAVASIVWPLVPALHLRGLALPNWHGFLLGAFVCWAIKGTMSTRWYVLYALALTGVYAITRDSFTIVCVLTSAMVLLVGRAGKLGSWLDAAWLQFLGKVSYSLYLLHVPISGAAFFVLSKVLGHSPAEDLLAVVLVIAINCVAAQLFWWGVERPSTALGRRLRKG